MPNLTPAFALEETDLQEQVEQLEDYCVEIEVLYKLDDLYMAPGDIYLLYTSSTIEALKAEIANARETESKYPSVTAEEITNAKQAIENCVENLCIEKDELNFLIAVCKKENGTENNGYYSDEMWSGYSDLIDKATELLLSDTASDEEINNAYWELVFCFNEMCVSNKLVGDVDNNGTVDVSDVTLVQKAAVGNASLNASQRMAAANQEGDIDSITVANATAMQKYIVTSGTLDENQYFQVLEENLYSKDPYHFENNPFYLAGMVCRYYGYGNFDVYSKYLIQ
ncbi:MAG: dockerin type I repeat-containing protein [Clostridiales bacterium]|nr:dockerin type I repeat-containing protein [Clostridiales bacterium]